MQAPVHRIRIQEGYPADVVAALNARMARVLAAPGGVERVPAAARVQSVIALHSAWRPGQTVTVAFLGGSPMLRGQIADAVSAWTNSANIHFDFWTSSDHQRFREWSVQDTRPAANIRIGFSEVGYWSHVGKDAMTIPKPGEQTMNLEGFDNSLPDDWRAITLHEFGHVLSFQHEHQSPVGDCQNEFRWEDDPGYVPTRDMYGSFVTDANGHRPGIYTVLGGPPNSWTRETIDYNLRQFAPSTDLEASAFDASSIMKYYFGDWMFRGGTSSTCYSAPSADLSAQDKKAASELYGTSDVTVTPSPTPSTLTPAEITYLDVSKATLARLQSVISESHRGANKR